MKIILICSRTEDEASGIALPIPARDEYPSPQKTRDEYRWLSESCSPGEGPARILSLFWKNATRTGIAAGMISGAVISIGWYLWLKQSTGIYELIPAFFGALLVIVVVSVFTSKGSNVS